MIRRTPRTPLFLTLVALAVAAGVASAGTGGTVPASVAQAKIASWVYEHTSAGQTAEYIVVLGDQADLSGAAGLPDKAAKTRWVHDQLWAKARATQGPLLEWLDQQGATYHPFYIVNAIQVTGSQALALALASRADVARIEGNPEIKAVQPAAPTVEELRAAMQASAQSTSAIEPGVTAIRAPDVWALGYSGQGIVIGGADTGVQWDHPALINHYRGWNGTTASHDYNWHDSIHTGGGVCGPDATAPCDDDGHGTHTLGTAVGADLAGTNQIGVAPGAKFIACRNMDQGNGTPARYIECMEWFLAPYPVGGTPAQGDPDKAPDITTNSWGCPASEGCTTSSLQAAVEAQRAAGIMFVAAAGNSGPACSTVSDPPSFHDASTTVGAFSSTTGSIASFSSRGPVTADGSGRMKPDISAPGVSVRSCLRGNTYGSLSGTSMATPHVAGAIALLWSRWPQLRNQIAATENLLEHSAVYVATTLCDVAGGSPNNVWGWGKLDIKAAVDMGATGIGDGGPLAPGVALAPAMPNPAHHATALRWRLPRAGSLELAIYSVDGRRVRTLAAGHFAAGEHTARWDGRDDRGVAMAPAVYHVRLRAADTEAVQKLIWLGQ